MAFMGFFGEVDAKHNANSESPTTQKARGGWIEAEFYELSRQ
jgi:hypothetical protein